ncbi:MAG: TetR/AcrR family transcriptional regulator [Chloroflexota bacterium]|jgi:TetR/AcrR family transcriptional regulator|nr:TetR/AcrR family transcriptional regulator [Chloroflexota bacterium]
MNNQRRLLDCALLLFSQRGYHAVSVRDIVDAAGVTKPTLYHYFGSKRGLLDALLHHHAEPFLSALNQTATYQGDLVLTLENIVRVYFDFAQNASSFYRLQLTQYFAPPESEVNKAIRPYAQRQHKILEDVFTQAVDDHGNLRGRHQRYAAGFLGSINAVIGLYLNEQIDLTNEMVYQTAHQFMYGIFS